MQYSGKKWVGHLDARPILFGYFGFGANYPDFKAGNPARTVTRFGGLTESFISINCCRASWCIRLSVTA